MRRNTIVFRHSRAFAVSTTAAKIEFASMPPFHAAKPVPASDPTKPSSRQAAASGTGRWAIMRPRVPVHREGLSACRTPADRPCMRRRLTFARALSLHLSVLPGSALNERPGKTPMWTTAKLSTPPYATLFAQRTSMSPLDVKQTQDEQLSDLLSSRKEPEITETTKF